MIEPDSIFHSVLDFNEKTVYTDFRELTKVFNQKSFLNTTKNIKKKCAIIIFDVNDFKYINDTLYIMHIYVIILKEFCA